MTLVRRYRVWRRRRQLKNGYYKIACAELDKGHGFSTVMKAWSMMEEDGYINIDDGALEWKWPENVGGVKS